MRNSFLKFCRIFLKHPVYAFTYPEKVIWELHKEYSTSAPKAENAPEEMCIGNIPYIRDAQTRVNGSEASSEKTEAFSCGIDHPVIA
jgi:hypothetical protein